MTNPRRLIFVAALFLAGCGGDPGVDLPPSCYDSIGNFYDMGCVLDDGEGGSLAHLSAYKMCVTWPAESAECRCTEENKALLHCLASVEYERCTACDSEIYIYQSCVQTYRENVDTDGDGKLDAQDNCMHLPNPSQNDLDGDGRGDACDSDVDGDYWDNENDTCPFIPSPDYQGQVEECTSDLDEDGLQDFEDNCPEVSNPGQVDTNNDGIGDSCQPK